MIVCNQKIRPSHLQQLKTLFILSGLSSSSDDIGPARPTPRLKRLKKVTKNLKADVGTRHRDPVSYLCYTGAIRMSVLDTDRHSVRLS
jgi:hypothetical protein